MPHRAYPLTLVLLASTWLSSCAPSAPPAPLYQTSTLRALQHGVFDGLRSLGMILQHGDFGLGTLNGLDGELVVLAGQAYRAGADGTVTVVPPEALSPFAAVTFFVPQRTVPAPAGSCADLLAFLEAKLGSPNVFVAVQVDGVFPTLTVRSVPKQAPPYPPLEQVLAGQVVFPLHHQVGSLIGFWTPPYLGAVSSPGWHLHFLARDRQTAGHLLDCSLAEGVVKLAELPGLVLDLPETEAYRTATLSP
ncbi:MAG: alpha-acetolactate decarboxylase [Dehalococcoidia bacterium]|nr:MAG: alpha-acetolactate decarboxylase [Dehalococcoidia bacterium]